METENKYYNAKPSKISNIGKDVAGAKRMNFDTYETEEERETKQRKKALDKNLKGLKEEFKTELFKTSPNPFQLKDIIRKQFSATYGFCVSNDNARQIVREQRKEAHTTEERKAFNKMVRAFNKTRTDLSRLSSSEYFIERHIEKLRKKYGSKKSFIEQSGQSFNWKDFEFTEKVDNDFSYLESNAEAVQFGNSVTDNERAYILNELSTFIKSWDESSIFSKQNIKNVSWSFGARGKCNSVAYYQAGAKLISVNRNNIGSLVHELGHHLDYQNNLPSNKISWDTIKAYTEQIKDLCPDSKSLRYYASRKEIFARAFEAYCYKVNANFKPFAQCGDMFLPELNEELTTIIKEVLA